ncbi:MAG: hypothetical protein IJU39_06825, partial [Clostridia bacterium]|nr:hypothetical protein [Clostridia bacterium]
FKATDMIFGNIFNVRNQPQQSNIKPRQVDQRQVTVSENDSTQMYSGEEIEQLLKNTGKGQQFVSYGKESSKGGDEDDIPAGESVAKIVKTVIAVIVAIIFIVAIVALLKNVVSDNDTGTTSQETQQTTAIESNTTQYETVATTAETTQAPTTTEAPSTTEPETQTEEPETEEPDADLIPYSEPPEEVTPQPVEPEIEE